jgi:hypothetical protein
MMKGASDMEKESQQHLHTNECGIQYTLRDVTKAILRGKFTVTNACVKKKKNQWRA